MIIVPPFKGWALAKQNNHKWKENESEDGITKFYKLKRYVDCLFKHHERKRDEARREREQTKQLYFIDKINVWTAF